MRVRKNKYLFFLVGSAVRRYINNSAENLHLMCEEIILIHSFFWLRKCEVRRLCSFKRVANAKIF